MTKKVLIIGTSPRANGNSNRLAIEFEKGAKAKGNEVEIVYLCDKTINFCKGCLACQRLKKCVIDDDANEIANKMKESDVIVWATPVYYYCISGQMKTMIDRANPLFASDYKFKDVYLLAAAADSGDYTFKGTINALEGWTACFSGVQLKGVVTAEGVDSVGAIEGNQTLKEAYELGKSIN